MSPNIEARLSMVQCTSHLDCQLPNYQARFGNLMRSIESSCSKSLATIDKVETDEELKSDFEAMSAYILTYDPVANKKDYSNKNKKRDMSNAVIASTVGDRNR